MVVTLDTTPHAAPPLYGGAGLANSGQPPAPPPLHAPTPRQRVQPARRPVAGSKWHSAFNSTAPRKTALFGKLVYALSIVSCIAFKVNRRSGRDWVGSCYMLLLLQLCQDWWQQKQRLQIDSSLERRPQHLHQQSPEEATVSPVASSIDRSLARCAGWRLFAELR